MVQVRIEWVAGARTKTKAQEIYANKKQSCTKIGNKKHFLCIAAQGIDLDPHPKWHHYRAFYDRGMPPPTHREAADLIIELLGKAETE